MSDVIDHRNPIELYPEDSRLTTFPLGRPQLFKWYEHAVKSFWTTSELDLSNDAQDYEFKLSPDEKHFVRYILAFFAASDGIVNLNLAERFRGEVKILEAAYFYNLQMAIEDIHAMTYSLLLDTIIPSPTERLHLLNAIKTMPIISKMSQYMFQCIDSGASFAERLLRMACVEGIFFTGCFCAIYWLQARGLMRGLGQSNELIARDEALHTLFALHIYKMIKPHLQLSIERVHALFREAVELASEFITEALPSGLSGINAGMMISYIKCQADNLATVIDVPVVYNAKHNLVFMEQINLRNRTNFFERKVSEYSKPISSDKTTFDVADIF
jgi:ribonucleotide reductase beta subunit family protein with ferritin-like domain